MIPNTTEELLVGRWEFDGSAYHADATCRRIEWLVKEHLLKIASSPDWGDWEVLYQDPGDGRYWELSYPQGDLQGGGPPQLKMLAADVSRQKYQLPS